MYCGNVKIHIQTSTIFDEMKTKESRTFQWTAIAFSAAHTNHNINNCVYKIEATHVWQRDVRLALEWEKRDRQTHTHTHTNRNHIIKRWSFELIWVVLSFRLCICCVVHSFGLHNPFSVHIFTYVYEKWLWPFANDNISLHSIGLNGCMLHVTVSSGRISRLHYAADPTSPVSSIALQFLFLLLLQFLL